MRPLALSVFCLLSLLGLGGWLGCQPPPAATQAAGPLSSYPSDKPSGLLESNPQDTAAIEGYPVSLAVHTRPTQAVPLSRLTFSPPGVWQAQPPGTQAKTEADFVNAFRRYFFGALTGPARLEMEAETAFAPKALWAAGQSQWIPLHAGPSRSVQIIPPLQTLAAQTEQSVLVAVYNPAPQAAAVTLTIQPPLSQNWVRFDEVVPLPAMHRDSGRLQDTQGTYRFEVAAQSFMLLTFAKQPVKNFAAPIAP